MDGESDEKLHVEYINQVIRDETGFDELVLTTAATIVRRHSTFLVKEPSRNSSHREMNFLMEILCGNDGMRCFEWKNMSLPNYVTD